MCEGGRAGEALLEGGGEEGQRREEGSGMGCWVDEVGARVLEVGAYLV